MQPSNPWSVPATLEEATLCYLVASRDDQKKGSEIEALDELEKALLEADEYAKLKQLLKEARYEPKPNGFTELSQNLCLLASKDWHRVRMVLHRLATDHPREPLLSLLLVKAILGCKDKGAFDDAVRWARQAVQASQSDSCPDWLRSQAHKAYGVALSTAAALGSLPQPDRVKYRREAINVFPKPADGLGDDALVLYNLGLLYAESRQYTLALKHGRGALSVSDGSLAPAWALVALILSGRRDLKGALAVVDGALAETNELYKALLVSIKSKLLVASGVSHEGIVELAKLCGKLQRNRKQNSWQSAAQRDVFTHQEAELWGELAAAYLDEGHQNDAEYCLEQMNSVASWTPECLYIQARIRQSAGDTAGAARNYETALAMDPDHALSSLHLGLLYRLKGEESQKRGEECAHDFVISHSMLSGAVRKEPDNHIGWYNLGLVCKAQGQCEDAKKYLQNAVSLAMTAPVKGFSSLPRLL